MGLLDLYAQQADTAAPNPVQALPRTLGERIEATAAETFAPDRYFTITAARRDMWQRAIDELHGAIGESFANPYGAVTSEEMSRLGNQPAIIEERRNKIIEASRLARARGFDDLFDPENIDRYIGEEANRRRERAASYAGTGYGFLNFLAGAAMATVEPINVLTLAVPASRLPTTAASAIGRTFLGNVSREAALQAGVNVGAQALTEAFDFTSRRETGTEQTVGEIAGNLAGAAVIGGLIGGGVRALHLKWLGLPESVREAAPLEVKDAFRVLEAESLYSGQNRLGVDPLLHERYQARAMDAVIRGTPVTLDDLTRTADTPLTALGTILRQTPDQIRADISGLDNALFRVRALPDSEIEAVLRETRPQLFATMDDIARRSAELDARVARLNEEMAQIGLPDIVDIDTGARLADIETRLQSKGLRRAERLDLERERDMIVQSIDPSGRLPEALRATRADFFPEQARALREIEEQRAALARETEAARSALQRELDQVRARLDALTVGSRFADEVPADVLARELGSTPADIAAAIQRADVMRQATMVREVLPEGRPVVETRRADLPRPDAPEIQKAREAEVGRILDRDKAGRERITQAIDDVLKAADEKGHQTKTANLGPVPDWLSSLATDHGLNIGGFAHTIDADAVRHIRREHGDVARERRRGQIAITDDDFARIPDVLASPDRIAFGIKTRLGRDAVAYVKRMPDGSILYLEEARTGRKRMAAVSMRKHPATMNVDVVASTLDPNGRADGGGAIKVVQPAAASRAMEVSAREELDAAELAVQDAKAAAACAFGGGHL